MLKLTHVHTYMYAHLRALESLLLAEERSWDITGKLRERGEVRRLESHFQSEREAPHQTCCTSAVVDTSTQHQSTVVEGQLALVLQCEVSDY